MTGEEYGELFREAYDLFETKQYDKAEEICNRLIQVNDKQAPIFNLLGLIKDKKRDINSAIKNLEIAVNIDSTDYVYLCNLGEFYRKVNKLYLALNYLEKSIGINFQYPYSLYNLGNIHRDLGNKGEAEKYYELAIKYKPDYYQAMNNLGLLNIENGSLITGLQYYKKALEIASNDIELLLNTSIALILLKKFFDAEILLKKLIGLLPNYSEPYRMLANVLVDCSKISEAKFYLNKYIDLIKDIEPEHTVKSLNLYLELLSNYFYFNNKEIDNYITKIANIANNKYVYKNEAFIQDLLTSNLHFSSLISFNGRDNKELKIKYAKAFEYNFFNYNKQLKVNKGKFKIAFLVTNSREVIFADFFKGIINYLDISLFEIYLICDKNGWEQILKKQFKEHIRPIFLFEKLIDSFNNISKYHLDILYFFEIGSDPENYFLSFFRMSHVQCTSIGWPETTGIRNMDYFISGDLIEIETSQEHYSEKLIKTKKLPLYYSKPQLTDFKEIETFDLPKNKKIYFCGQNLRKIHPDFDYLILNILKKDLDGIVVFIRDRNKVLIDFLKQRLEISIDDESILERIYFLDLLSYQNYLSLVSQVDVVLDTLYFGGAITAYDFFAMGAPVVTYPWTHERGRYTLGCYKQMEIEGLVANSLDEYVDLAVKTANDKEFRDKIVKDIKENNYKLYDDKELIQEYNELFKNLAIKHRGN